jgi:hypothetical protein
VTAAAPRPVADAIHITAPRTTRRDGASVAEVDAGGAPLWFASSDAALRPSGEAFASALLVPALTRGARLVLDDDLPLGARWRSGADGVRAQLHAWWGFDGPPPSAARTEVATGGGSARGLCFSGGADSFHSLLAGDPRPDALVFVRGYDVLLHERARAQAAEAGVRAVAREAGVRAIVVTTNLRDHPAFAGVDWVHAHGGALAAVGHLLAGELGSLAISASYPFALDRPWGSHWRLDPLWSSEALEVVHLGAELWRKDKLSAIAAQPLAQRHLRVCWEHRTPALNCSACEKCVRTMLRLAQLGVLDDFAVFDRSRPLEQRLDELPPLRRDLSDAYAELAAEGLPRGLARAVERLQRRSGRPPRRRRLLCGRRAA